MTNHTRRPRGRAVAFHHQQHEVLLLEELRTLFRIELIDPRLISITIVAAQLSADGSTARVAYAQRLEDPGLEEALERASGFLRARLAESLHWKRTPRLKFISLGVVAGGAS
ncbi:MAG: ribosome-binding factor A [Myxococcales bacterium]|nr:ribosome-binding factor A [Myxococcales bacterium]